MYALKQGNTSLCFVSSTDCIEMFLWKQVMNNMFVFINRLKASSNGNVMKVNVL